MNKVYIIVQYIQHSSAYSRHQDVIVDSVYNDKYVAEYMARNISGSIVIEKEIITGDLRDDSKFLEYIHDRLMSVKKSKESTEATIRHTDGEIYQLELILK